MAPLVAAITRPIHTGDRALLQAGRSQRLFPAAFAWIAAGRVDASHHDPDSAVIVNRGQVLYGHSGGPATVATDTGVAGYGARSINPHDRYIAVQPPDEQIGSGGDARHNETINLAALRVCG